MTPQQAAASAKEETPSHGKADVISIHPAPARKTIVPFTIPTREAMNFLIAPPNRPGMKEKAATIQHMLFPVGAARHPERPIKIAKVRSALLKRMKEIYPIKMAGFNPETARDSQTEITERDLPTMIQDQFSVCAGRRCGFGEPKYELEFMMNQPKLTNGDGYCRIRSCPNNREYRCG